MDNFKIKPNLRRRFAKILNFILLFVLAFCVIRVWTWEHRYYQRMEGSERSKSPVAGDIGANRVDETDISKKAKNKHKVAADLPRFLSIKRLKIRKARVFAMGAFSNGQLKSPNNIFDVAWYNGSDRPGKGGTSIFDGHNGGPTKIGVFKHLIDLTNEDIISIEMGNGKIYNYRVVDNRTISLREADEQMSSLQVSPIPGKESISLITCIGEWSAKQQTYLSRQFVRAVRI